MPLVLIVEDEEHLRATLAYNLRKAGYDVQSAASGPEAVARFQSVQPDLVLFDVMLPGFDGFEVCRRIRKLSSAPTLMLTARTDEVDAVVGLELGADDYIAKPFRMRELLARVGAALRRPLLDQGDSTSTPLALPLIAGDLQLDPLTYTVRRGGQLRWPGRPSPPGRSYRRRSPGDCAIDRTRDDRGRSARAAGRARDADRCRRHGTGRLVPAAGREREPPESAGSSRCARLGPRRE